jgi:SAM-dependent methyltransferase
VNHDHTPTSTPTSTAASSGSSEITRSRARRGGVLRGRCPGTTRWRPGSQGDLAPSGARARVAANLAALEVLAALDASGAAPEEGQRRTLARWSGWGAVPAMFDDADDRFAAERAQLHTLLDEQQFAAEARSTLNAHYTDLGIVAAVWDAVAALGFTGGQVLEPGCGSGNFLHLAPASAQVTAVELDPTTAAIAAVLHPETTVRCESFADTPLADGSMDLAIGNVPFGAVKLHDRRHNPGDRLSIHNHFILRALHLVRPGGLVAVLTSRYTLDARDPGPRRKTAELADLLGAIRLPSGAHEKAAGTDAVSDLLVLRRRPADRADTVDAPGFETTSFEGTVAVPGHEQVSGLAVNRYFAEHPDRVLGEFALRHGPYNALSLRVTPHAGDLDAQLRSALDDVVNRARAAGLTMTTATPPESAGTTRPTPAAGTGRATPVTPDPREGMLAADGEGGFTRVVAGTPTPFEVPATQAAELVAHDRGQTRTRMTAPSRRQR